MAKLTPMMQQYMDLKGKYKDCILFFRLGDFYEMFFEDAITASRELEITLTKRDCGQEEKAPMCGVPHHSAETYINKLLEKGYKVAIGEQVEDPKEVKGIVKRDVVRVVTPGTNINPNTLDEKKNNYLMCLYQQEETYGVATVDITTGDFYVTQVDQEKKVLDEVAKFMPSEILYEENITVDVITTIKERYPVVINALEDWYFDSSMCEQKIKDHFNVHNLDGLGLKEYNIGTMVTGALLQYLYEMQKNSLKHITTLYPYTTESYMMLDSFTRRNLELVETLRDKQRVGSLIHVLDKTKTAMGARLLRKWIEQPLLDIESINHRLNTVEILKNQPLLREELRELLQPVYDLERLMGRISYQTANPRDLIAFKQSIEVLPAIEQLIKEVDEQLCHTIYKEMDLLEDVKDLIEASIIEDPPITIKEGHIIKLGYNEGVDTLRKATTQGKQWIAQLEAKEKEKTNIKSLKIKFNKVFGYYIEVTKSYLDLVPEDYVRKQTLANAERYITPELKEMEDTILGAEEKVVALEYDLFVKVRDRIGKEVKRIKKTAKAIATLDVLLSYGYVAERQNYVKPVINDEGIIDIKEGRHPVVEKMINNEMFITNETYLDNAEQRISIITGPNMAGKSTYMRQVALIVLMAQIGSFVPANEANIGIVDRIFTRVGASDDLASGQSTFMVEMTEVANILRNATKNSLIILDEIGRGTSTFDGLSIAWSVVEYISNPSKIGAKTLFATHYHELTELEGKIDGVNNYCIAVKEQGDDIIFLRKIIKGGADQSYGIQVAKLAGVPNEVILRAKDLVNELAQSDITKKIDVGTLLDNEAEKQTQEEVAPTKQISLFEEIETHNIIKELEQIKILEITPMEAFNKLYELQKKLKG
ncbi:DNA mismatch repair protein MutS [Natranaerovirga hydrolytica]|uniref:DNA mismatch repair protein MutS n=1 Tax=Natranaerovirga hydrolytica TaxID=680378 RepID=A0A4R1MZK4_9FIRM|nr:DNA mismatch repair protein MutS [Natranaerovirga hydrolytica]TCK98002.1 DNA mismatch repair protein MutS [Natranaerovirga hydrolytica]